MGLGVPTCTLCPSQSLDADDSLGSLMHLGVPVRTSGSRMLYKTLIAILSPLLLLEWWHLPASQPEGLRR